MRNNTLCERTPEFQRGEPIEQRNNGSAIATDFSTGITLERKYGKIYTKELDRKKIKAHESEEQGGNNCSPIVAAPMLILEELSVA
eukprot:10234306-Heterocapsa_arctica.AAC.1